MYTKQPNLLACVLTDTTPLPSANQVEADDKYDPKNSPMLLALMVGFIAFVFASGMVS